MMISRLEAVYDYIDLSPVSLWVSRYASDHGFPAQLSLYNAGCSSGATLAPLPSEWRDVN